MDRKARPGDNEQNREKRREKEEKEKGRCLMKKILAALLVLALVAPAMADVSVTATDNGSQQLKISLNATGGAVVRGIAVKLTVSGGQVA